MGVISGTFTANATHYLGHINNNIIVYKSSNVIVK